MRTLQGEARRHSAHHSHPQHRRLPRHARPYPHTRLSHPKRALARAAPLNMWHVNWAPSHNLARQCLKKTALTHPQVTKHATTTPGPRPSFPCAFPQWGHRNPKVPERTRKERLKSYNLKDLSSPKGEAVARSKLCWLSPSRAIKRLRSRSRHTTRTAAIKRSG